MGPQRVLQAAAGLAVALAAQTGSAAPDRVDRADRERIALVDLGPGSAAAAPDATRQLAAAITAAGFAPVGGDGLEDALAGREADRDALELTAALADAQRAFGALACADATAAARKAVGLAAARQAAGRPVPELPRALAYILLCADRENQLDAALAAAGQLRALGGSPEAMAVVPASVLAKYPGVDAVAGVDLVELDIDADVPGAAIWIDFQRAGASPLHIALPAGDHVIAAAAGDKRGWAAGTAVRSQHALHVPLTDAAGPWTELARRVAGWHGELPAPTELAWLFSRVHARVALIRRGDTIDAWGQVGRSELPHRIAGSGPAPLVAANQLLTAVTARIRSWNDHAPDPDRPLLTEDNAPPSLVRRDDDTVDKPTKWWVYAAIAGAGAIVGTIVLVHDAASDRQHVELHYP